MRHATAEPGTFLTDPLAALEGWAGDGIAIRRFEPGRQGNRTGPGRLCGPSGSGRSAEAGEAWPGALSTCYLRLFGEQLFPGLPPRARQVLQDALAASDGLDRTSTTLRRLRGRLAHSRADAALHRWATGRAEPLPDALRATLGSADDLALALHGLVGAVCRASAMVFAWTVLLDRGWRPGMPSSTTLPPVGTTQPPASTAPPPAGTTQPQASGPTRRPGWRSPPRTASAKHCDCGRARRPQGPLPSPTASAEPPASAPGS